MNSLLGKIGVKMRQVGDWDLGHIAAVLAAFLIEQQIEKNNQFI